jgi:hypothetical protein
MSDSDARGFTMLEKEAEPGALPKPDFASFLISLGSTAFVHMGLLPDPESGKTRTPNLPVARQTIDMLELLEEKTRGNLTADEATLLRNLLTDLRLRFVSASRETQGRETQGGETQGA